MICLADMLALPQASMESDTEQLRDQLKNVQADLAAQTQLTQAAVDSEAAMQLRLTAEEENNNALKAALDMQTKVGYTYAHTQCRSVALLAGLSVCTCVYLPWTPMFYTKTCWHQHDIAVLHA